MPIKDKLLKLPVWKAGLFVLLFVLGVGIFIEEVLVHHVFHFFDQTLLKMENDKRGDLADRDAMEMDEQKDFCVKYQRLLEEKAQLAKRSPSEFGYDFDYQTVYYHNQELRFAIQNRHFNLVQCVKSLKSKVN